MATLPLGDIARFQADRRGAGAPAVTYPDGALSYGELEAAANRRARWLADLGVEAGDTVTLALGNSVRFHELSFAIWKLGGCPNVVPARLPGPELGAIVALARPRLVVSDAAPDLADTRVVGLDADLTGYRPDPVPIRAHPHWKAMTSGGSTGRPKLIVDNAPAEMETDPDRSMLHGYMRMRGDGVVLNPGPLHHNGPFLFSHLGLFAGCHVVGMARFDAEEALRLIEAHRVTWVSLVPTMMHRIWSLPARVRDRYDLSSLETVWHMAAPCPAWLKAAWIDWLGPDRIWELYGGTEGIGGTVISGREWLAKPGSVGRPGPGSALKVAREDGSPCAPGEVGELFFMPPQPASSHYLGAELRTDGEGWASLGDMGHVDAEGYVFLADRRSDLILRGGANVYPAEVEAALEASPDIASAVVVGLPCAELGQRVHAIVQPRGALDPTALRAFVLARLAGYKATESFEAAAGPLRDDAGKVRRGALRDERLAWLQAGRPFQLFP